jgi:hypothetical protein
VLVAAADAVAIAYHELMKSDLDGDQAQPELWEQHRDVCWRR